MPVLQNTPLVECFVELRYQYIHIGGAYGSAKYRSDPRAGTSKETKE